MHLLVIFGFQVHYSFFETALVYSSDSILIEYLKIYILIQLYIQQEVVTVKGVLIFR